MRLLALLLFLPCVGVGQVTFQKAYGDSLCWRTLYCHSVKETFDKGFIVTGLTTNWGPISSMIPLLKVNSSGNHLWTNLLAGPNISADNIGESVIQTSDSGFVVVGRTNSHGAGSWDVYMIKTDVNGNPEWDRTYGGNMVDVGMEVIESSDGGYVITGHTLSVGAGNLDVLLIKTDINGNQLWAKAFGGPNNQDGQSVIQTSDGGYVVAGYSGDFGAGGYDFYLIKTDINGNLLWTRTVGGTGTDMAFAVIESSDGGLVVCGKTNSYATGNSNSIYLVKTNSVGNVLWARSFGGNASDEGYNLVETNEGGYLISGHTLSFVTGLYNDVCLLKTDVNGNFIWARAYGGDDYDYYGWGVDVCSDGGFIVANATHSWCGEDSSNSGSDQFYLIKTDTIGYSGGCNDSSFIALTDSGAIVGSGGVDTSFLFIEDTGLIAFNPIVYESTICYECVSPVASFTHSNALLTVTFFDSSPNNTNWYWDFGDGNNDTAQNPIHTYTTVGTYWVCLIATNDCGTDTFCDSVTVTDVGIIQQAGKNQYTIYPNPTSGSFSVQGATGTIRVHDLFGRMVHTSTKPQVDMSYQPKGVYIVKSGEAVRKLLLH